MNDEEENNDINNEDSGLFIIRKEIEKYTKNIEHEKINLRLAKERFEKQYEYLNKLQNKGKPGTKEVEGNSQLLGGNPKLIMKNNVETIQKELITKETMIKNITDEINLIVEENKLLKQSIGEIRKDKINATNFLESLEQRLSKDKQVFEQIYYKNKHNKMDSDGLLNRKQEECNNVKKGKELEEDGFVEKRDYFEKKYHDVVEENIKFERERKRKKYISKNKKNTDNGEEENEGDGQDEDISDRAPILHILIEKWKAMVKAKKEMFEKYIKNSNIIANAFEKMLGFLGTDNIDTIPLFLEKMINQMESIDTFISKLTEEEEKLENEIQQIQDDINSIIVKSHNSILQNNKMLETKKQNISKLQEQIKEIEEDIDNRKQFFISLQETTDPFLKKLENSYITNYIPFKVRVMEEIEYNENNIMAIIANVQDYQRIIDEIEKNERDKRRETQKELISKEIDRIEAENKSKLEVLKKEVFSSDLIKKEFKVNSSYDNALKRLADEVLNSITSSPNQRGRISAVNLNNLNDI